MIEVVVAIFWVGVALTACLALLFLPGFWVALHLGGEDPVAVTVASVLLSVVIGAIAAGTLISLGVFSGAALALVLLAAAAAGFIPFVGWLRRIGPPAIVPLLGVALAATPWLLTALRPDLAPANTLQWYYWDLGSSLTASGGIPATVAEYGEAVRWLPDYVFFNATSEAYGFLLSLAGPQVAIQAFRVPVVIAGIGAIYLVARLWMRSSSALIATALTLAGLFFQTKFNAYKPESVGVVIGLLSAWLIVTGLRRPHVAWAMVGAVALGVAVSFHAIAATVIGFLVVGACVGEIAFADRPRWRVAATTTAAGVLAFVVVLATGIALQGRPLVAADALRPAHVNGVDPTWKYLEYSTGQFDDRQPPGLLDQLANGVASPWTGVHVDSMAGLWLLWLLGLGMLLALLYGDRRTRQGLLAGLVASAVLALGILFFALAFATYVPRHTGLARFAQYVPLVYGLAMGFAAEGLIVAWARITGGVPWPRLGLVAGLVAGLWLVPTVIRSDAEDLGISATGRAALAELQRSAAPGDVVISNAITTGILGFGGRMEAPLEGRQPLLEEPKLLARANDLLLGTHLFFELGDPAILDELDVDWVVGVDRPRTLGVAGGFGGSLATMAEHPRLVERWRDEGIAIFQVTGRTIQPVPAPTRSEPRLVPWVLAVALVAALAGSILAIDALARRRRPRTAGVGHARRAVESLPERLI